MQQLHASEWIDRCSKRLQEHWRTVEPAQLDDVAIELWWHEQWRALPPEDAAVGWLRQGVLAHLDDLYPADRGAASLGGGPTAHV